MHFLGYKVSFVNHMEVIKWLLYFRKATFNFFQLKLLLVDSDIKTTT